MLQDVSFTVTVAIEALLCWKSASTVTSCNSCAQDNDKRNSLHLQVRHVKNSHNFATTLHNTYLIFQYSPYLYQTVFFHVWTKACIPAWWKLLSSSAPSGMQHSVVSCHPQNSVLAGCISEEQTGEDLTVQHENCWMIAATRPSKFCDIISAGVGMWSDTFDGIHVALIQ